MECAGGVRRLRRPGDQLLQLSLMWPDDGGKPGQSGVDFISESLGLINCWMVFIKCWHVINTFCKCF